MIICSGILFFVGAVIFFTAKVKVSSRRLITGTRARVVGILLMLPVPLSLLIEASGAHYEYVFQAEFLIWVLFLLISVIVGITTPSQSTVFLDQTPPIMTIPEAARYLKVSEKELRRLIENGQLQATLIGNQYRIAKAQIDAMFQR